MSIGSIIVPSTCPPPSAWTLGPLDTTTSILQEGPSFGASESMSPWRCISSSHQIQTSTLGRRGRPIQGGSQRIMAAMRDGAHDVCHASGTPDSGLLPSAMLILFSPTPILAGRWPLPDPSFTLYTRHCPPRLRAYSRHDFRRCNHLLNTELLLFL